MVTTLRRSRTLLLGLILLSPGVSRAPLERYHPCPMAAAQMAEAVAHGDGERHTPNAPDHAQRCRCVDACCQTAVALTPPSSPEFAWHTLPLPVAAFAAPTSTRPVRRPARLLPPATAPPTA